MLCFLKSRYSEVDPPGKWTKDGCHEPSENHGKDCACPLIKDTSRQVKQFPNQGKLKEGLSY